MAVELVYMVISLILSSTSTISNAYDHFKLVNQWPASYCQMNNCRRNPLPRNFTIHGLWPDNYNQRTALLNCGNPTFTDFKDPFRSRLDVSWPDLQQTRYLNLQNQVFWKRQWKRHGSCSFSSLDQDHYFAKAVELKDKISVLDILRGKGIRPGTKIDPKLVNSSIADVTQHLPIIKCANNILTEIIICVGAHGVDVEDCKPAYIACGNAQVNFP